MKTTNWHGCYADGWRDLLVPEAFGHPAKFSYGLIQRIIRSGLARGFWGPGSLIGDPFAGVACGGLVAAYHGLRWLGEELEQTFVDLGNQNIQKHRPRYEAAGDPVPVLVQGDSRQFASIVGQCEAIVTSPPYAESLHLNESPEIQEARMRAKGQHEAIAKASRGGKFVSDSNAGYGHTPGQIGSLKAGELDAVVTSPPYAESIGNENAIDYSKAQDPTTSRKGSPARDALGGSYGSTEGNIGNLKEGQLDAVVTSPPWAESEGSMTGTFSAWHDRQIDKGNMRGNKHGSYATAQDGYGSTPGQIGQEKQESYWQAVAAVYEQCRLALKPGGYLVVVVKDYVSKKKRVPLCDQTMELLTRLGFDVFERTRAWLVEHDEQPSLFGGTVVKTKERKSFFRRLAEKKGSPRIDFEEVIWARTQPMGTDG